MRSDQKDYQLLAEAYANVQEQEQLDEFAGFGTGGVGDKFLKRMPTFSKFLPGNMAGKANARVDTASFVKQNIEPVFDKITQTLGDRDQVDLGQVADIVGNAYGVDPDSLKTFSKYQQNGQITGTLPVSQARDLLFPAAADATGVAAARRYPQKQNGAGGYTPVNQQAQTTPQQAQTTPQQPGPDENGAWSQPRDGIAKTIGKFGLNAAKKLGGAAVNKMRDFNADMKADAQKATDANNVADAEAQKQKEADQYAAIMSKQDGKPGNEQTVETPPPPPPTVTPPAPPAVDNLAKIPGESDITPGEGVEEVEAEPITPGTTEPSVGDNITQTNVVDAGDQQQQTQVDQKGEIEPTVITPPAPKSEEEEEENQNQQQLPLKEQYKRPLGGCGFMRNTWGTFNK